MLSLTQQHTQLHIETGLSPLFIRTLKLHVDYLMKVLDMSDERLPKIIAMNTIERRSMWYGKLEELAAYCGADFHLLDRNRRYSKDALYDLIAKVDEKHREDCINMATSSVHRSIYSVLNHNLCERNYFHNENSQEHISSILKLRGELVGLNYIPHRTDVPIYCSLCNTSEREDVIHFIGKCPILKEIRRNVLGSDAKSEAEVLALLNCERDDKILFKYYKTAITYRTQIINEAF